jgi:FtsP/CotA-like multicopper oxidase with cupredoxin domain
MRTLEIAPHHSVRTAVYETDSSGVFHLPAAQPIPVEIHNTLGTEEWVHWHGLRTPTRWDGTDAESSVPVAPGATLRYTLPPQQPGLFYVHSHSMTCHDVTRGLYSGQFAPVYVRPRHNSGAYDQEVFWTSHEWEPYMVNAAEEERSLEEMQHLRIDPEDDGETDGWEMRYRIASVNGRALGHGEPLRVKEGERVLFHFLNASATENIEIALPGHTFEVIAMDGNPVPNPHGVLSLSLGAGERICALVAMTTPGVWILGSTDPQVRALGLGTVVEYAGRTREPVWNDAPAANWDYTLFAHVESERIAEMIHIGVNRQLLADDGSERWQLTLADESGRPRSGMLRKDRMYRLRLQNNSEEWHPMHLHRHRFEVIRYGGKDTAGLMKDTILLPAWDSVDILLTPKDTGRALFHCHNQMHMEAGLQTLFNVT